MKARLPQRCRVRTIFSPNCRGLLGERAWFGGDAPSLADLMLGPQLEMFARAPEWAELTGNRANLCTWLDRLEARPAMQATLWEALPARIAAQPS